MPDSNNPAQAAVEAVETAQSAVAEATEQVATAAEQGGVVGAVTEVPQALAEQVRTLLDQVAHLTSVTTRLEATLIPAQQPAGQVPSQPIAQTAVPDSEVEIPPSQIIPRKPHWFHRLPKVPLITG